MNFIKTTLTGLAVALGLAFAMPLQAQEPQPMQQSPSVQIPFEQFTLDNGLTVFLLRDNTLPIISVNIWFNVGSKDERPGRTGFAHLFEHLMFMGTDKVPNIDDLLESGGGSNNASTREDVTNYYTVAPENMLETVLFIEADRLANLANAMTQEKLDKQREIVLNERKQSYENQPYGISWLEMPALMYPKGHPYAHTVIGSTEDIRSATVEDVVDFFNTYYVPANATLIVAGDFDAKNAKELVKKYFGPIAKRPEPQHPAIPQMTHPQKSRLVLEDNVQLPRLILLWHSPAFTKPGDAELDILATILCKGKNSRLINRLVYEKQLASSVSCGQASSEASMFMIDALPMPGASLDAIEAEILSVIKDVVEEGVTQNEFDKTKNGINTSYIKQLQSIGSRADSFNSFYFYTGSTDFPNADLVRYNEATRDSLQNIVHELFTDDTRRATIIVNPAPGAQNKSDNSAMDEGNE